MSVSWRRAAAKAALAGLSLLASVVSAQESRGTITGIVTDISGGVVQGAQVTVVNSETNGTSVATTGAKGQYTVLYLTPGSYSVAVEQAGFRKTVRPSVAVRVGDKAQIDFVLEPMGATEEVNVVAERPLLESGTGAMGHLVDSTLITQLPLGDGTAYSLTRLVPGTSFEGGYALQRPMDNGNLFSQRVGGTGRSEFTLDGSSNVVNVGGSAAMGISPPAEAIQEFKFETAAYDAQVGHTGAGAVNLALKSGSNAFHGSAYYFDRDDSRSANDFASNRGPGCTDSDPKTVCKAPRDYYRYGATVTGPIVKDKTFFMVSYESLNDLRTEPRTYTVPTERMRNGDFSELLANGTTIYNPFSGRLVNNVIVRDPFPGNVIPQNLINPVARNVINYYPLPNQTGTADGQQNFFVQQPWTYKYDFQMVKIDHQWSSSQRSYLRVSRNWRDEERDDFAGVQQGIEITRGKDTRYNYALALGHTATLSSSMFLDVKANVLRFASEQSPTAEIDLASLGFASTAVDTFDYSYIPRFNVTGFATLGYLAVAYGAPRIVPFYNYSFNPTVTKISGGHSLKVGYDLRMLRENRLDEGYKAGQYNFDGTFSRTNNEAVRFGQPLAQFLLGLPQGGNIDTTASRANEVVSHGFFVHDDWRVNSKLTLNLGVRYDYERPLTERYDRNTRGFDFTSPSPIQAAAQARYAAAPPVGVPLSAAEFGAKIVGGYQYLDAGNRTVWNADTDNIQPRLGFAYKATEKTVIRGGAGLFIPLFEIGGAALNQIGYSRPTTVSFTSNQGLSFAGNLTNPVPSTGLLQPIGSSQGLRTNLGNAPGNVISVDRENAQTWRFSIGLQQDLGAGVALEVSYIGQRAQNLPYNQPLNRVPQAFVSPSRTRDNANETFLSAPVANPFQGLLPDAPGVNGATITRGRLLTPYPQFGDINREQYDGSNSYNAGIISLQKRFAKGSYFNVNYTLSRLREKISRLNPFQDFEDRISPADRTHRFVFVSVLQLPFGRERRWGSGWSSPLDAVLGGWQATINYQLQTGEPLTFGNVYWDEGCGDPASRLKTSWGSNPDGQKYGIDVPAFDTSCFYFHDAAVQTNGVDDPTKQRNDQRIALTDNNVRYFPSTIPSVRGANHHSLDIGLGKTFRLGRGVKLDVRAEALNALNTTIFRLNQLDLGPRNANFGKFNNSGQPTVVMLPRDIQIGARLTF